MPGLDLTAAALGALFVLAAAPAGAATVYRWADEQGKIHYSEVVPEPYRSVARPLGIAATEPTPEQRREALERARREKARATAITAPQDPPLAAEAAAASASRPPSKRPAQIPGDQTDCASWQRLYLESVECFGPYRTVRGATKPEAFEVCNVVPEPPPSRCRQRIP